MQYNVSLFSVDLETVNSFSAKLGKKATESNIALYHGDLGDDILNIASAFSYPEKIETVFQCAEISECAIVALPAEYALDYRIGELVIILDYLNKKTCFVIDKTNCESDFKISDMRSKLEALIANTSLKGSKILDASLKNDSEINELTEWVKSVEFAKSDKPLFVMDHFFDVKSIGTVLLGELKTGVMKAYDKFTVYPIKTEVLVKSMQVMDVDQKEVSAPIRPGLAVKGVKVDKLKRGFVLSSEDLPCVEELSGTFEKNPFYKNDISVGEKYRVALGAQVVEGVVEDTNFKIKLEKPLVKYLDTAIIFRSDLKSGLRVVGKVSV
jgi:selenocysteine-specific translation elongation factor|tara:strand:- start:25248 stop:26222 length:975 start_codon:yes stop_codon:yes gene_type:complete